VLANEVLDAGEHRMIFNGCNLASGVYFIRLEASNRVQTEKMVMLK
jgi:hypothetical protein